MAPEDPKPDVLSSLPRTRPQRRSAKRDAAAKPAPKRAAANGAKAPSKPRAKAAPKASPKPRKVPEPRIPPAGFQPPPDKTERPLPTGVELIGTAIQAAGELAQIGLAVGRQALGSVLERTKRG